MIGYGQNLDTLAAVAFFVCFGLALILWLVWQAFESVANRRQRNLDAILDAIRDGHDLPGRITHDPDGRGGVTIEAPNLTPDDIDKLVAEWRRTVQQKAR